MRLSRRSFLASSLVALPLTDAFARAIELRGPKFPKPDIIRYDASCFTIRGQDTLIYSLEFPYPRIQRSEWPDRFRKIRAAGFNTIDTYVFWNYHERERGHFDLSELEAFLRLSAEQELYAILRPGPYVDAEFERGGFPAYVIAKRFRVRSMHPESLRTSRHWYDQVLPVIRRHQITHGGNIIIMQIENEIDFTDVPRVEQREYLRYLARLAWDAGIDVPLISNVSTVVREYPNDPDMARIIDVCDFYPRWSFLKDNELPTDTAGMTMEQIVALSDRAVLASLRKMRMEIPDAPLSVAELGTGYYSKVGVKLSEDEEGADAAQLNALAKTIIANGVTYMNFYIGVGGTNFDWSAKGVTTTYDFAAPLREGGGLSDKYYELRAIGETMRMFGPTLARSEMAPGKVKALHHDVTVYTRVNGSSAFAFVRADTDAQHHFRLQLPSSDSKRPVTVPRHGVLKLGPHAMKMLPIGVAVADAMLLYTTAELLGAGKTAGRSFLILYDLPGALVEFSVAAEAADKVTGPLAYSEWRSTPAQVVVGMRAAAIPQAVRIGERLLVILLSRELALRTWIDRAETSGDYDVPWLTDAYLLAKSGRSANSRWADIDFLPGTHAVETLLPTAPRSCHIDGADTPVQYDPASGVARLTLITPALPVNAVAITRGRAWIERVDKSAGKWQRSEGRTIEDLGPVPFGYVKYETQLVYRGEQMLYLNAFGNNDKKVFINGRLIETASIKTPFIAIPAPDVLPEGANTVQIIYEQLGSNEFGENARMTELNGIDYIALGSDPDASTRISDFDVQTFAVPMRGRELSKDFRFVSATTVELTSEGKSGEPIPAATWYQTEFILPETHVSWTIPWQLAIGSDRDALIYLNERFVGRYAASGPQTSFYLPSGYLEKTGTPNRLTVMVAYTDSTAGLATLRIEPMLEHSVKRSRIEFDLA